MDQFLLFYLSLRASKFAQWKTSFYFLLNIQLLLNILLTYDVIEVNECFHDFMFVSRAPPPPPPLRSGKFSSTALVQSLAKSLLHHFVDYSYYSSPIRGLFVDYSRTIRTIRRLFADYSYYSSTIRAIRFTILVLSITVCKHMYVMRCISHVCKHTRCIVCMHHVQNDRYYDFCMPIFGC